MTQQIVQPVAQRFKLNADTIAELKAMTPEFGYNGLGELVFRRTYSRDNEDWGDVVIRVVEGCMSIRKEHFFRSSLEWDDEEWNSFARDMAISLFRMEWLPPGRGLWMMGQTLSTNVVLWRSTTVALAIQPTILSGQLNGLWIVL